MCILKLLARNLEFKTKEIRIGKKKMNAFLADTQRRMTVGLMFRKSMKQNECMLFIFPNDGDHPIWMRNMKFSIDIVWLDHNEKVVDFVESAKPASRLEFSGYHSKGPARYVVEFNAGFAKKNKIKINDVAKLGV